MSSGCCAAATPRGVLLLASHFLRRIENKLTVVLAGLAQQTPELAEILGIFA